MGRTIRSTLVCLALASAMHLDWHFARPAHHQLSLGLSWHWVLAIPAFGLVAWYVQRTSPDRVLRASVSIVLCAILIAGVVEPAYEYFLGGATSEWAFGLERIVALATFVAVGVVAHAAVLAFFRRRASIAGASAPAS